MIPREERADEDNNGYPSRAKPDKGDLCQTADSNIEQSIERIIASPVSKGKPVRGTSNAKPDYLDMLERRFALSKKESAMLAENQFVVLDKVRFDSHSWAYHELYQSEVPVFISADSILHSVYLSNDALIKDLEKRRIMPALTRALASLRKEFNATKAAYPAETQNDLDIYLGTAEALLELPPAAARENAPKIQELLAHAVEGKLTSVSLFGRERMIDFSQFTPRGHYTEEGFPAYFRAAMWLSRIEFNLVSRSCRSSQPGILPNPEETPREAYLAVVLAGLAERSGAQKDIGEITSLWSLLAGPREDVSLEDILRFTSGTVPGAPQTEVVVKLQKAIGSGFSRTVNFHYMPQGTTTLPVIATLLGPRITADSQALQSVVDPAVPDRHVLSAVDAAAVLGNQRALLYLSDDVKKYPALPGRIKERVSLLTRKNQSHDFYSSWLGALHGLSKPDKGELPAFMRSVRYADFRLNTTIAGYGQLRHNYVLMAAQSYDFGGCRIPDGYVEPLPALYEALIAYADRGAQALQSDERSTVYFRRIKRIFQVLKRISQEELQGLPLSHEERRFLSMVAEMREGGTGQSPLYTGWYFDLFPNRAEALKSASFISDFYTSTYANAVSYAGVSAVDLGLFIVDTGGKKRVFAGPVARAFTHSSPIDKRLTDEDAAKLTNPASSWSNGYVAGAAPAPPLKVSCEESCAEIILKSTRDLGNVTIELLDHNRRPIQARTAKVGAQETTKLSFTISQARPPEMIHVIAGSFHGWTIVSWMGASASWNMDAE